MPQNIGVKFIEKTKYNFLSESDQVKGAKQPTVEIESDDKTVFDLPAPETIELPDYPLRKAIEDRRSARSFSKEPFTQAELSYLLWCTQGVQRTARVVDSTGLESARTYRTVPSAGARHAFETFVFANHVDGLPSGLYRFKAVDHKLTEVRKDANLANTVASGCLGQMWMARAAAVFIWVADTYRMTWRYCERGYRYMLLDAGHVCQNLYLAAESIDSGVCAIAAYDDDEMNRIVGVDGVDRFVIYIAAAGKKHPADSR